MYVDLHLHSVFSDGTENPRSIVERAKNIGLDAISLTDHDTVLGTGEMFAAAEEFGIKCISGIEISAIKDGEVHILGYGMDVNSPGLQSELRRLAEMRRDRNKGILEKLKKYHVYISEAEIADPKGNASIGRSHIAKAMVRRGYTKNINEAFDRWLGYGKPAYLPSFRVSPEEAIALVSKYGKLSVLAHPCQLKTPKAGLEGFLKALKDCGLGGIEAFYSTHKEAETKEYLSLAKKLDLQVTCGSDFHGFGRIAEIGGVKGEVSREMIESLL